MILEQAVLTHDTFEIEMTKRFKMTKVPSSTWLAPSTRDGTESSCDSGRFGVGF